MTEGTSPANAGTPNPANAGEENNTGANTSNPEGEGSLARVLEESKKFKARALAAEKELAERKKNELTQQGEYKKLYETEAEKNKRLYDTMVSKEKHITVSSIAAKAGCQDVAALMKLGNQELLVVDQETMTITGTDAFVEEAKKSYPWLFAAPKTPVINAAAPHGAGANTGQKTLKEMSKDEIMSKLRSLS